jgi:serine/threonine protein kinase
VSEAPAPDPEPQSESLARLVDQACNRFEAAWRSGGPPRIEDFLAGWSGPDRSALLRELVLLDVDYRRQRRLSCATEDYGSRFPDLDPAWLADAVAAPSTLSGTALTPHDHFEKAWKGGLGPRIEEYLAEVPEADRVPLFRELLALEIELRCNDSEMPTPEEYHRRFGEHIKLIDAVFANAPCDADSGPPGSGEGATTPHPSPSVGSAVGPGLPSPSGSPPAPDYIGRYKVVRRLGGGTFGDVYLAHDGVMNRQVAIKVPSPWLLATERAREEFLREARSVSRLQHEGIVRAYDFGQEVDGQCYIVYEFIDGASLAERIKPERIAADPLPPEEVARIVAEVAEALHHAHLQGLVHRDVKPANILLDRQGRPKVTDFGLAVREEELAGQRGILAGTLPYMSPEQVHREGHHLDGRTDVYSLGVVLYELICGRRPFTATPEDELIDQILHREARPPRQVKDSITRELERVCLKALGKRVSDRYTTARDMAEELRAAVGQSRGDRPAMEEKRPPSAPNNEEVRLSLGRPETVQLQKKRHALLDRRLATEIAVLFSRPGEVTGADARVPRVLGFGLALFDQLLVENLYGSTLVKIINKEQAIFGQSLLIVQHTKRQTDEEFAPPVDDAGAMWAGDPQFQLVVAWYDRLKGSATGAVRENVAYLQQTLQLAQELDAAIIPHPDRWPLYRWWFERCIWTTGDECRGRVIVELPAEPSAGALQLQEARRARVRELSSRVSVPAEPAMALIRYGPMPYPFPPGILRKYDREDLRSHEPFLYEFCVPIEGPPQGGDAAR